MKYILVLVSFCFAVFGFSQTGNVPLYQNFSDTVKDSSRYKDSVFNLVIKNTMKRLKYKKIIN